MTAKAAGAAKTTGTAKTIGAAGAAETAGSAGVKAAVDAAFREEWGRVVATLIRVTGDWDLAEECAQEIGRAHV